MKKKIVNLLKYNKIAYSIYYVVMSFCINVLKIFIRVDDKLILFNSYAGRKFDDSPKAIFEVLKNDPRFSDYKIVWAFHNPESFEVQGATKIKTDGFKYFVTALKARVWITNSSVERGLHFKRKKTFYLNTWHGTPIKKMGSDITSGNTSFASKSVNTIDIMNAQSLFEADIFSRCFGIPRKHFIEVGLPRNDALANYSESERLALKKKLNIPEGKKVILYCPTFREYEKDENLGVVLAPPMDLDKWERELRDDYVLLFRAHYEVSKVMEIKESDFLRNATDYPLLSDLMIVSDILLSDYSSIFFDYSIMDKCMIHFTYDYDKYNEQRGMYFDIRDYLSGADTEDGVMNYIKNMDYDSEVDKTRAFRASYMNFYGNASKKTVDCIAEHCM